MFFLQSNDMIGRAVNESNYVLESYSMIGSKIVHLNSNLLIFEPESKFDKVI